MFALIDALNAHPRLSNVRASYHVAFDSDDVLIRAIVSGNEWGRCGAWVQVPENLWSRADAATTIAQALIDRAEKSMGFSS